MFSILLTLVALGFVMLGAAIIGEPRKFHHKYRFVVEIDGFQSAGFKDCSGLKGKVAVIEHFQGGSMLPYKEAGRYSVENVTLTRGVTTDQDAYRWFQLSCKAGANAGTNTPGYKKNLAVVQLDRDGSELRRWNIHNAFVTEFEAASWDNSADEVAIETMVLAIDYFDQPTDGAPV